MITLHFQTLAYWIRVTTGFLHFLVSCLRSGLLFRSLVTFSPWLDMNPLRGYFRIYHMYLRRCSDSIGGLGGSFLDRWSLLILCTASSPTSIDFISYCDISYVREMSTAFPRVSSFRSLINFSWILREFFQKQFCHGSSRRVPWKNSISREASGPLQTVLPFLTLLVLCLLFGFTWFPILSKYVLTFFLSYIVCMK